MESWNNELYMSLVFELEFKEDIEDELENDLFLQMVDVVSSEFLDESSTKPKVLLLLPSSCFKKCHLGIDYVLTWRKCLHAN